VTPSGDDIVFANDDFVVTATEPGLISVNVDQVDYRYAVNILSEESDFTRAAVATLYDSIINPDTDITQSREVRTAQLIEELERPQRMWWWILVSVMLLILAEAVVANRTYR